MLYLITLLLALLASASPLTFTHRSPATEPLRMSEDQIKAIYKTCWDGKIPYPELLPPPMLDIPAQQLNIFRRPQATGGKLTVVNYCGYDIFYDHFGGEKLLASNRLAKNGGTVVFDLTGTVIKAIKTPRAPRDFLLEYGVQDGKLTYDMSMITCLGSTRGMAKSDTSACPGHEGGLQLGNAKSMTFQCAAGAWCDDQVYMYEENLCKKYNPNHTISPAEGLTMEFCAAYKK